MRKYFDTISAKETVNELYDLGFQNYMLPLVGRPNKYAGIAVKTSIGIS